MPAERLFAPATTRNREPILDVLRRVLPSQGTVLEVASGSGEHAVFFAARLPNLVWQPSDADPVARDSIAAWTAESGLSNVKAPLPLDAVRGPWELDPPAAIFCANMIHIAPWPATLGLLSEAGRLLVAGAPLILYGPFQIDGQHTSPSNAEFDASLRGRNPSWGVRDRTVVAAEARRHGLALTETVPMPANNQILIFRGDGRGPSDVADR